MTGDAALIAAAHALLRFRRDHRIWALRRMTVPQLRTLFEAWPVWAHCGQLPPDGEWRVWLMLAGRGFGKTRAGAEWVSALARARPDAVFALVGATPAEVERVMIGGSSGLIAVARAEEDLRFFS